MKDLTTIYKNGFKRSISKSHPFFRKCSTRPYEVLEGFFDAWDIASHLKIVKQLFDITTKERYIAKAPNSMTHNHQLFSMLVKATWVIDKTKVKYMAMPFQKEVFFISGGNLDIDVVNKYLTEDEVSNPYLGFFHCYNDFELAAYHRNLYYCFFYSLTAKDFLLK